jgi:hypothetical protein
MKSLFELPPDVTDHVFSYWNPYKGYYTKNIIKTPDLWEAAWKHFYRGLEGNRRLAVYYLLCTWGVFKNSQIHQTARYLETKTYYPTDLSCNIIPYKNTQFFDVYVYSYVPTSRFATSRVLFVGIFIPFDKIRDYYMMQITGSGGRSNMMPVYDDHDSKMSLYKLMEYGHEYGWSDRRREGSYGVHSYPYPY